MLKKTALILLFLTCNVMTYGEELFPEKRAMHTAVYVPDTKQMLVFGGVKKTTKFSDLWSYSIKENKWEEINTKKGHGARHGHSAIYVPDTKQMLIFGGVGESGYLSELWSYDVEKKQWEQIKMDPEDSPLARSFHSAVYDSNTKQMLVFGGNGKRGTFADLWAYDIEKKKWEEILEDGPPARANHTAVYDPNTKQMLVFGGSGPMKGGTRFSDIWSYDTKKKNWKKIEEESSVAATVGGRAIYDSDSKQVFVFGGFGIMGELSELWTYDVESLQDNSAKASLKKNWQEIESEDSPQPRYYHSVVYDSANKQMLIFGGSLQGDQLSDLCAYNIERKKWKRIEMEIEESPEVRAGHSTVYDFDSKKMIVYGGTGGRSSRPVSDLWAFDIEPLQDNSDTASKRTAVLSEQRKSSLKNKWEEINNGRKDSPPARSYHSAVYDSNTKQMLVFGGNNTVKDLSDLWAYNIKENKWEEIEAEDSPDPRHGHSAVYDSDKKQMFVFGGASGGGYLSDLWTYDIENKKWKEIDPQESPPPRQEHSAVYVPEKKQMLVFGGRGTDVDGKPFAYYDLWAYDTGSKKWKEIKIELTPQPSCEHSAVYDSDKKQMLVFGGNDIASFRILSDLWSYDIEKKKWDELILMKAEESPLPRREHSAVYASDKRQMLVFGGYTQGKYLSDLWSYDIEKKKWKEIKQVNGILVINITDLSDNPKEGVEIKLLKGDKEITSGKTDKKGICSFESLEEGDYKILITKPGTNEEIARAIQIKSAHKKYISEIIE